MPRSIALLMPLAFFFSCAGCAQWTKTRYAMDDPVYAAKYEEGAAKTQPLKKLKQAIDARHVEGLGGVYLAGGTQWRDDYQAALAGAELGFEAYPAVGLALAPAWEALWDTMIGTPVPILACGLNCPPGSLPS